MAAIVKWCRSIVREKMEDFESNLTLKTRPSVQINRKLCFKDEEILTSKIDTPIGREGVRTDIVIDQVNFLSIKLIIAQLVQIYCLHSISGQEKHYRIP
jgi:hypothetical protein